MSCVEHTPNGRGPQAPAHLLRALGYARVSTDEQAENGFSLPEQANRLAEYCRRQGYALVETITDDFTGKTLDRPGLNRVTELAAGEAFDVLVAIRLDRLARFNHLRRQYEEWLEDRGIEVLYVDQKFEATAAGRLQRGIMGELAEYQWGLIREETMRGRVRKARDHGKMPGGCRIFGYRLVTKAQAAVLPEFHGRDGELILVPEEAYLARQMFERAVSGQSLRSLAAWLNETGAKPPVGARWARSSLHHMLRNTAYVGRPYYGKQECRQTRERTPSGKGLRRRETIKPRSEWIELSCPPIVSEALFAAVQARLDANREQLRGRRSDRWPLSGIVFCGVCAGTTGGPLRCRGLGDLRSKRPRRHYICPSAYRQDLTPCRTRHKADELEDLAHLALREAARPGRLAAFARREAEKRQREAGNPEGQVKAAQEGLGALEAEEAEVLEQSILGFSPAVIRKKLESIQERRGRLERQLAAARARLGAGEDPEAAERHAAAVAERLADSLVQAEADPGRFQELCRLFLTIRLYPDRRPRIETRVPPTLDF